ncbi:MAG: HEPN domain-containing protein [Thalassospira sp.]|uniref:hypothetical protein n=1 Tax=Thalassospira sp. TaxID=1912094 RepID=UPI0032EA9DE1
MAKKQKNHKVSGHPEIRKGLTEFLKITVAYQFTDGVKKRRDPTASGWRLCGGTHFLVTVEIHKSQIMLSEIIERRLGHAGLNRKEIDAIIWEEIVRLISDVKERNSEEKLKEAVKRILEAIDTGSTEHHTQFFQCRAVRSLASLKPLVVGPVSILDKAALDKEVKTLGDDEMGWSEWPGNFIWRVETQCGRSSSRAQAEWAIDICCGIFTIVGEDALPFDFYRAGWQLAHPMDQQESLREEKVIRDGRLCREIGMDRYCFTFDERFVDQLSVNDTRDKIALLFLEDFDSVGGRLGIALGWLARGLYASNSETRLLFFSTALETILVAGREGVTDQLARNAACVLTDDNATRGKFAILLREFYQLRSTLVHEGDRRVYRSEVNNMESITIDICHRIWVKADLSMSFDNFGKNLKNCSFGTPMQWHEDS